MTVTSHRSSPYAGEGFSEEASAHVVTVPVPRSTNYPNAVLLCDVLTASATEITCRTRPHAPSNAGDPVSTSGELKGSPAGSVTVAQCADRPESDIGKYTCWSRAVANSAAAECTSDCTWAYMSDETGVPAHIVGGVLVNGTPGSRVVGGVTLTVNGSGAH